MATVCRYMVVSVVASLATLSSAEENCWNATTTVNPSKAPNIIPMIVRNGESAESYSVPADSGSIRYVSHMQPSATTTQTPMTPPRPNHIPPNPPPPLCPP